MTRLKWIYVVPLLVFAGLVGFLVSQNGRDPSVDTFSLLNKPLPAFTLPDLQHPDQQVSQKQWLGHPYFMNVWATWCNSCAEEHEELRRIAGEGVPIYGVLYKDQRAAALDYLAQKGNPFAQIINDEVGNFGIDLGVTGAPETFLIDAQGVIRFHMDGPVTDTYWQNTLKPRYQALLQAGGKQP